MKLTKRQELMLEALSNTFFNITEASKQIGMNRKTHYDWLNDSNDYKKACEDIENSFINIAESQLKKNINEGKETSLIFFLKCKGNYRETQEIISTQKVTLDIK